MAQAGVSLSNRARATTTDAVSDDDSTAGLVTPTPTLRFEIPSADERIVSNRMRRLAPKSNGSSQRTSTKSFNLGSVAGSHSELRACVDRCKLASRP